MPSHPHPHPHPHPHHAAFVAQPEGADPLSLEVFRAFKTAMLQQRQLMLRLLASKGSHPAQAGCLGVLAEQDGISQRDLATGLHVSRPTVTTMLQKMEKSGLIERRADEQDQRLTRIYLTAEGRRMQESLRSVYSEILSASIDPMPEADRREFLRLLEALSDNMSRALAPALTTDEEGATTESC